MSTFIVPTEFSVGRANAFITYLSGSQRYIFAADHRPSTNTSLSELSQAYSNTSFSPWQQMIFGKAIDKSALGIRNFPYEYGTTYAAWDDKVDMTVVQWYTIVNAGSFHHIFGCLSNANNSPSTVQPDFSTAIASDNLQYVSSDGYKWMYYASVSSSLAANLATADYFPLTVNTAVSAIAVPGAISQIRVENGGKGYNNYCKGNFQSTDIKVNSVSTLYQMSNTDISSANGFYQGCVLLITSGTGVGQFSVINDYFVNANGNFANLATPFSVTPTNGSAWEVMPGVVVKSNGTQTNNVIARAIVNAAANTVDRVEVLNRGAGYLGEIFSTNVVANAVVGVVSPASVRSILPPLGGHGHDAASELGATVALLGCTFSNTEGGKVPATNTYRQIGIVTSPTFANVQIALSNSTSLFENGEVVDFVTLKWGASNASVTSGSNVVTGDTRLFSANSSVLITSSGVQLLSRVSTITNSTSMVIVDNLDFSSNAMANLYSATLVSTGTVINPVSTSNVFVTNVGNIYDGLTMYGKESSAMGVVSEIRRNDVVKDSNTFIQLTKLKITSLGGSFVQNETILQGNSTALVHSSANGYLYLSNLSAPLVSGNNVVGNTSGAVAQVTGVYQPELVVGSGTIEYLENTTTITRASGRSESFIVCYRF